MSKRNSVQRAFDAFGEAQFRVKRSGTWIRETDGVAQTFNLQKSQYGLAYYLNVRLDFTAAVPAEIARDEDELGVGFYIEGRAERFLSEEDASRLRDLLDIDGHPLEEEHRELELLALLFAKLRPVLGDLDSLHGIEAYYQAGAFRAFLVSRSARRVLVAAASQE